MLTFTPSSATFIVEEIPAYLPSGEGEHTFVWIEKVNLTTFEAVRRIAGVCDLDTRDIGYAGMKDRHATTRQWLSIPRVDPARALEISIDGLRVLEARRHGNKLRTGHLHGNRFEVVLKDDPGTAAHDAQLQDHLQDRVRDRLQRMARHGLPNHYGEQRFGATGENAVVGLALLRGERRERDPRRRRLLLSAAQSAVFNRYLDLRGAPAGDALALRRVRAGDVLQKTGSGGLFVCEDPAIDQPRVDAGEILPTGPMPGTRVMEPPPDSEAGLLEQEALGVIGASREDFARGGRDLPGARRAVIVTVDLGEPAVAREPASAPIAEGGDGSGAASDASYALRVRFSLPSGSYATVVIDALLTDVAASIEADKLC